MTLSAAVVFLSALGASGMNSLPTHEYVPQARHDLQLLERMSRGIESAMAVARARPELFVAPPSATTLGADQKAALLELWGPLFAYFTNLETIRQRYWDFVTLSPTDARHAWGYLVTHAALTAELAGGLEFAGLVGDNKAVRKLLNEAVPAWGISARAFANLETTAVNAATTAQLFTGKAWVPFARKAFQNDAETQAAIAWAFKHIDTATQVAEGLLKSRGVSVYAAAGKAIMKHAAHQAVFPTQKSFAEWMGDTRVHRAGTSLVKPPDVTKAIELLEPGDIVVSRQDWFLSNLGLPGFWPHAQLYLGDTGKLMATFDGEHDVQAWARSEPEHAATFSELLQKRFPEKWQKYAVEKDFQGHGPVRVIESISEGVSFTATEHAFGVDFLGAMRPRLSKLAKAQAIVRAFAYQGRPYDFDFDFDSDATLVCTELVMKSYAPSARQQGVTFPTVRVAGRTTLPANDIVRMFDEQLGTDKQQLDFVFFLDGNEKTRAARLATVEDFRATHRRPKWDVLQP